MGLTTPAGGVLVPVAEGAGFGAGFAVGSIEERRSCRDYKLYVSTHLKPRPVVPGADPRTCDFQALLEVIEVSQSAGIFLIRGLPQDSIPGAGEKWVG